VAFVDQEYTGTQAAPDAAAHGLHLELAKLPKGKQGVVLLPRRWVGECSFAWMACSRRLARDYICLPATLAGFHFLAFTILILKRFIAVKDNFSIASSAVLQWR
jgi:hypothetical protein